LEVAKADEIYWEVQGIHQELLEMKEGLILVH
jgi:hypothetical protein